MPRVLIRGFFMVKNETLQLYWDQSSTKRILFLLSKIND